MEKSNTLCWSKLGVFDSVNSVPKADAYIMKMILHDWSDDECVKILANIYQRSPNEGTVFIAEHMVPGPEKPHFSKLFDIQYDVCRHWERKNDQGIRRSAKNGWLDEYQDFVFSFWTNGSNTSFANDISRAKFI